MKLIVDSIYDNYNVLTEAAADGTKNMFISGIFAQAEKQNRNKRTYPKAVLENSAGTYIKEYVTKSRGLGELNHPPYPKANPAEACILTTNLEWDGNDLHGKAKVLSTPKGQTLKALLNDGVQLGVSTRGLGTLKSSAKGAIVENDFIMNAIDVVYDPSGIDCFVDGIMEGVEYYYNNGILTESRIDEIRKNISNNDMEKIKLDFRKFLNACSFK